ncbi:MAG TPA: hypothetical protein DHU85_03750 [Porphyromonadaceae bacterium]|jgi:hypothetical protein|nr:hypothetical protein [Porphyromonadaceae bacterium]
MSNNITFTGRVSAVLPVESGTSASGKSWSRQTIVITEENVQYPASIAVTLFNSELVGTVAAGEAITAHLSVKASEYQGKYYNNISAWKIERTVSAAPVPTAQSAFAPAPAPQPACRQDDLPF